MAQQPLAKKILKNYGLILISSAIYALAFDWFFQPNHIAFGGFTGVAQILNSLWDVLPVGVVTIVMNVPLFLVGVRKMGLGILFSSLKSESLAPCFSTTCAMRDALAESLPVCVPGESPTMIVLAPISSRMDSSASMAL